jgi:pyridoxamine 5'-phosphate oxidase
VSSLQPELPADPLPLAAAWLEMASDGRRNPHAMALATSDADARPSVRMVLLKELSVREGYAVFYTNYGSRKAVELRSTHRAAGVLYWENLGRQLRFEGAVVRSPAVESDAYFATRPWRSQINAWSSEQSRALADFGILIERAAERARELGLDPDRGPSRPVPRPDFWGGFRLWFDSVEFWVEGVDRFHERVRYVRALEPTDAYTFRGGPWSHERLQP